MSLGSLPGEWEFLGEGVGASVSFRCLVSELLATAGKRRMKYLKNNNSLAKHGKSNTSENHKKKTCVKTFFGLMNTKSFLLLLQHWNS